jgi:hypothetical protein
MQAMCQLPQDVAITAVDAHSHPLVGELTAQKGEITSIALWLLAERSQVSKYTAAFVRALPVCPPPAACCPILGLCTRPGSLACPASSLPSLTVPVLRSPHGPCHFCRSQCTHLVCVIKDMTDLLQLCVQATTLSPILWDDSLRANELRGSPVLSEARGREAALRAEWADISAAITALPNSAAFNARTFCERSFLEAVAVVLAHAIYLPTAQCFALLPLVSFMRRTGVGNGCDVDYDAGASLLPSVAGRMVLPSDVLMGADIWAGSRCY